jgi:hypothetical protein
MVKRKADESAFEFRQRKKRYNYKKAHQYDDEQTYWKQQNSRAYRVQRESISDLFAGVSAAEQVSSAVQLLEGASSSGLSASSIGSMFGGSAEAMALGEAVAAGAVAGVGVAGLAGGALGYLAGEAIGSMFTQNTESVVGKLMPGTYQGKFALSAKASQKGLRDKYQKKGAVFIEETYGSVADPDTVYVGHSTYSRTCIARAIGLAVLRKLFRVGVKFNPTTIYEELPLISSIPDSGPDGFVIVYSLKDSDGTEFKVAHDIPNDFSLGSILTHNQGGFVYLDNINSCLGSENPFVMEKVLLYMKNGVATRLVYDMDMKKEILSVAMSSHMVIQNRTKSASGANNTTEVDAQPLKGPVFEFSLGVPKLKATTPDNLNYMLPEGIMLVRAGALPGSDPTAYKEVPVKNAFQGVVKSGYTRLNPGALKSMTIGSDCSGYYGNVLFKLRVNQQGVIQRAYGKSQMVILEEELNSGSTNLITISYECQHIAGADLTTTSSPNMQPGYQASSISNAP